MSPSQKNGWPSAVTRKRPFSETLNRGSPENAVPSLPSRPASAAWRGRWRHNSTACLGPDQFAVGHNPTDDHEPELDRVEVVRQIKRDAPADDGWLEGETQGL